MKITAVDCLYSGNDMIVRISTDEGITGYGEATFTARQKSVEMMVETFVAEILFLARLINSEYFSSLPKVL